MTAACAAIWLAVRAAECGWLIPICERFEVAVEGNVGSNMPCVAVCFRVSPLTSGDDDPCVGILGEPLGREKF